MERLSTDIILEICKHIDSFSILSWMRSCSYMRKIWLEIQPFTRIVSNCKQFDSALRDQRCHLMLITGRWIAFNENTKDEDIPPRHIEIIGYYNIAIKMASAYPLSITFRHIRPYLINLDTPYWDITFANTSIDVDTRIVCCNLNIYDSRLTSCSEYNRCIYLTATRALNIEKFTAIQSQNHRNVRDIRYYIIKSNKVNISSLNAIDSRLELDASNMSVSNSQIGHIYIHESKLPNQVATITDCVLDSTTGIQLPLKCKLNLSDTQTFYSVYMV